jgi:ubiquinone/menaquinone biosynthesis C-methylase UbiE
MDELSGGAAYVQDWHHRHAGATTVILGAMADDRGRTTYQVLADAIIKGDEPVLDLACGDGHLLELLRPDRASFGADLNPSELAAAAKRLEKACPLVRSDAAVLPIHTATLGTVGCHYALMLLQPLEQVLAELARVLRPNGLLAAVLPGSPPVGASNPISVFRNAWHEVNSTFDVSIPEMQDDRALDTATLVGLLTDAGFTAASVRSYSVAKRMMPDEAVGSLLLTYLPDLLPEAGFKQLRHRLETDLVELAGADGNVTFVQHSQLVCARRDGVDRRT